MPPVPLLDKLPVDVKQELHQRLYSSAHGDTFAIAAWLTSIGYPCGKSTVNAYSLRCRDQINEEGRVREQQAAAISKHRVDTRLRVIEVCARRPLGNSLLDDADTVLAWVRSDG